MSSNARMERTVTAVAGIVALLVLVILPAAKYMPGFQYQRATLETEAEINGRLVTTLINANPTLWHFQAERLVTLLSRRPGDGTPEI